VNIETAAINLNPFLNIEVTPKKKVKLKPRQLLPVESPVVCGLEGQEMPGSVFESAVERFDSHRSQELPDPVVPQPGFTYTSSGLFNPSPAPGVSEPSTGLFVGNPVNCEGEPQPGMMNRDLVAGSVQPSRVSDVSCALGTTSQPSVLNRSSVGLAPIPELGISVVRAAGAQPVMVEAEVGSVIGGQQFGVPIPRATGVEEGLESSNPFTLFMRSTPLNGSVYVPPAVSSIRGSFRRSVARERRRIQVFYLYKDCFLPMNL